MIEDITPQEQLLLNDKRFIGKPCPACNNRVRYKRGCHCVICQRYRSSKPKSEKEAAEKQAAMKVQRKSMDPRTFLERERARQRMHSVKQKIDKNRFETDEDRDNAYREMYLLRRVLFPTEHFEVKHGNITFRSVNIKSDE